MQIILVSDGIGICISNILLVYNEDDFPSVNEFAMEWEGNATNYLDSTQQLEKLGHKKQNTVLLQLDIQRIDHFKRIGRAISNVCFLFLSLKM